MREKILNTPWTFMRWLRLGVGIYALVNLFFVPFNVFFLLFGLWFTYQALFNYGCGACSTPMSQNRGNEEVKTVDYEEIT